MEKEDRDPKKLKRVAITGPESSGKSDLAATLAWHYNSSWAPEFARTYLESKVGDYTFDDLEKILLGQQKNEQKADEDAQDYSFYDTDVLVIKIWSEFRFGKVSPLVESEFLKGHYDFHLLCCPDLPWAPDPLRESPSQKERIELFGMFKHYLDKYFPDKYAVIRGTGEVRLKSAIDSIERLS